MLASELMSRELRVASPDDRIDDAWDRMEHERIRHLPIVERDPGDGSGSRLVGIVSDRDVLEATGGLPRRVHACRGAGHPADVPCTLQEIMKGDVRTVPSSASVEEVAELLLKERIGCVPVLEGPRLVGLVTETDLLKTAATSAEGLVEDWMDREPLVVSRRTTASSAWKMCLARGVRHLVVVQGERPIGIVSDRDLRRAAGVGRRLDVAVEDAMTPELRTVPPGLAVGQAIALLRAGRIGALPVVHDDRLVGILSVSDVLRRAFSEGAGR